ncbi:hypothetical protein L208DRAFT_1541795 [Tricholoma matsutake]|nr:hypothetical protein L208DRAFT_1541795 [Tricholoma matsutake 945]
MTVFKNCGTSSSSLLYDATFKRATLEILSSRQKAKLKVAFNITALRMSQLMLTIQIWKPNKTAFEKAGHVCGKKLAMIAHLIGNKPCPYASKEAKKVARIEQGGVKDDMASTDADDESEGPSMPAKKRKRIFGKVKESMKQTELKVFKGISILFNDTQETLIWNQFLHASISTNLPFNGPRMLRSSS